jgi:NDP-sugar pyrophosphorylase family protein
MPQMHRIDTAIILAAGLGTRLAPLTTNTPKPLLDIAGKPMIVRILEHVKSAGINRIIVVIRPQFEQLFKNSIPESYNVQFVYQQKPTGMTDAILAARPHVKGDFVVCAGDMVVPHDHVIDVVKMHDSNKPFATLSLIKANVPYVKGMGNVAIDGAGTVTRIIEKPPKEHLLSNIYSPPFYAFSERLFEYLDKCPVSTRGERELQDAIQIAIQAKQIVKGVLIKYEFSKDEEYFRRELASLNITDIKDYFNACMTIIEEVGVQVSPDILCTLIEPVRIGKDCNISDNALIGPGAIIGNGVLIESLAEISNAIIQDRCKIGKKCFIDHAIIMSGATLKEGTSIVGSASEIKLVES